jgi:predicted nucleic acid-binding protein
MEPGNILADTCIWIEYFRGKTPVSRELEKLIQKGRVMISGLVLYELLQGVKNKKDAELIKQSLLALPNLDVSLETWSQAGDLFFELRRQGITLPPSDVLLAAIALENHCHLFTKDLHFDRIPKVSRYKMNSSEK